MKKVYFISGLGADKRVFNFLDLSFCEPVFIEWQAPGPKESLAGYAAKLRQQISDKHPFVVGISFGGMLASEMARADENVQAVILASNKSADEFPRRLRLFRYLPVYRWLPGSAMKKMQSLYTAVFGIKEPEKKEMLNRIIADADVSFVKWAIRAILHWQKSPPPAGLIHIHGTADRLLPISCVKADYVIEGGSHILTLDKPEEVSRLLKKIIQPG
ncbi:MAG TPA: alpha/beta hydrolase [Chitinophagaceae bacterium]|nr:alpha/beta hydrolase [Chitinophagaceae bacterium]